jgi:hypothetical protein
MSLRRAAILALSPASDWRLVLALSKHPQHHLSPKPQSQASSARSMISRTHTAPHPRPPPSTPRSTAMSSHAHGEHFPQSPSLLHASLLALRPRYGMWLRPTGQSLPPLPNGLAWSFTFVEKTNLQLTPATTLASRQQVAFMAWLLMLVQTYSEGVALAPWPSGWTTTFSSGSRVHAFPNTMNNAKFGNKIYKRVGGADRAEADYGTGEGTSQMVPLKSSMRTATQCSEIWQKRPPEPLRTSTSPMPTPTSTKSQHASEYGGNPRNLSPLGLRSHTLASAGIYVHARSTFWTRRGPNTWLPLRNGRRSAHTTSWTPRGCTESYSMPCWSYLQGELTSPAWRPCLPHSIMVLSFRTHPHRTPHSTSDGGNSSSAIQASQGLSHSPAAQLTTGHSRMPALGLELQS